MIHLLLGLLLLQLGIVLSASVSLESVEYKRSLHQTVYTYSVDGIFNSWTLEVGKCDEIKQIVTAPSASGISLNNNVQITGLTWSYYNGLYILKVAGHVKTGTTSWGISLGAYKTETGIVDGPQCAYHENVECDAGTYAALSCHNHQLSVTLLGHGSLHAASYHWEQVGGPIQGLILSPNSVSTLFRIENPHLVCWRSSIRVRLTVYGHDPSDKAICFARLTAGDRIAPTLSNMYQGHLTVEPHDIPVAMLLSATDDCDENVQIQQTERRVEKEKCSFQLIREWVARDDCGNTATHEQIITVLDTVPPVLVGVEQDGTYECDKVPPPCTVESKDYNAVTVEVTEQTTMENCDCRYTIKRKWTATDCAGNKAVSVQNIKVTDDVEPQIFGVPPSTTVDCGSIPDPPTLTATDNCCGATLNFYESREKGSCLHAYTIERTWVAHDSCDNRVTKKQIITVKDDTPPVLSGVDDDMEVPCNEIPVPCDVQVNDDCDLTVSPVFSEVSIPGSCLDTYVKVFTWEAVDDCGNTALVSQTVNVVDDEKPNLYGLPPHSLTVDCDAVPVFIVTAKDNCDETVTVFTNANNDTTYTHDYVAYTTWSATDRCGNKEEYSSTLTVEDNEDPVLIGVPDDMIANCESIPAAPSVEASDNCCESYVLTPNESEITIEGTCPDSFKLVRKWDIDDCSHNSKSLTQTITVEDNQAPTLHGLPGYKEVKCDFIPVVAVVSASDNCDEGVTVDYSFQTKAGSCKTQYKIFRTWTATDVCGNKASYTQTIVTYDDEPPVFNDVPIDQYVECQLPTPLPDPSANDTCDEYMTIYPTHEEKQGSCDYELTLYRFWSVQDDCGNVATATQTIYVQDNNAPYWITHPIGIIEKEYPYEEDPEDLLANDTCVYAPVIVYDEQKIQHGPPCDKGYDLVRTWMVRDDCGNIGPILFQKVVVTDTTPPVMVPEPADETVECDKIPPPAIVTASDHYEEVTVTFKETTEFGSCNQDYDLHRMWTAVDSCGNDESVQQIITVEDTTPPIIWGVPSDHSIECEEPAPANVSANDNCDGYLHVSLVSEHIELGGSYVDETPLKIVYRHWSVSDNCGNEASAEQTIRVYDTKDPYFINYNGDITVSCETLPGSATGDAVVGKDDCDPNPIAMRQVANAPGTCDHASYIFYHWEVVDHVGHKDYYSQTITVVDVTPPWFTGYEQQIIDIECDKVPEDDPALLPVHDNCDPNPVVTFNKTVGKAYGCDDNYVIYWLWNAVDHCGNTVDYVKTINVYDRTPPVIICNGSACEGYDIEVECLDPFLEWEYIVTGTDNCCLNVSVTHKQERIKGTCVDAYLLVDTWTVKDSCDLYDVYVRSITVVDTTPPVWGTLPNTSLLLPYDANLDCPSLSATDICDDDVLVTCTPTVTPGICPQDFTKTCNCRAEDNCGNAIEFVQIITVYDNEAPNIPYMSDETYECMKNLPQPTKPMVEMAYGHATVTLENTNTMKENCTYIIVYTWLAVDDCALHDRHDQTVFVTDENPPVIYGVPGDVTVECHQDTPVGGNAIDECDGVVFVFYESEKVSQEGLYCYTIVRSWSAVDHCGQIAVETQTVYVIDDEAPIMGYPQSNIVTDCHSVPFASANDVTVSDNCDTDVSVNFTDVSVPGSCECEYTQYRTWTACDSCGNCKTTTQTVIVEDILPPSLSLCPTDQTVQSVDVPAAPVVSGHDNYGEETEVNFTEIRINSTYAADSTFLYILIRHWSTFDECLNEESCTQTITVIDTIPPKIPCVPKDNVLDCIPIAELAVDPIYSSAAIEAAIVQCISEPGVVVRLSVDQTIQGSCDSEYIWIRCWEAEDHPGNVNEQCLTLTVVDNTPPWFTSYPDVEFAECQPEGVVDGAVLCEDNCDGVTVDLHQEDNTGGTYIQGGYYVRTWTCTDMCGHSVIHTQTIWVSDTIAPTWDILIPDQTAECDDVPTIGNMTCKDVCHNDTTVTMMGWTDVICESEYTVYYNWRCVDPAGNWISHQHSLSVYDTQPPILYAGNSLSYNVNNSILVSASSDHADKVEECPWVETYPEIYAKDNCIEYPWNLGIPKITRWGDDCERHVVFEWSTSDKCGNEAYFSQTVTIKDTLPPTLTGCPSNETVYLHCGDEFPEFYIHAEDECDPLVNVVPNDLFINSTCSHEYAIHRTWTAEDWCGLKVNCSVTFQFEDREAPLLELHGSPNITIPCDGDFTDIPSVSATDDCQDYFTIAYNETRFDGTCPCEYSLYRVWDTTDKCGKPATTTQLVVVEDNEAPTLGPEPGHVVVDCKHVPPAANLITSDNCCEVTLEFQEFRINLTCLYNYKLVRVWTATDECGHVTEVQQTITVIDNDPPTFSSLRPKYQLEFECDEVPTQDILTAVDECDGPINVLPKEISHPGSCFDAYFLYRSWHAEDECGNSVNKHQTITVVDYTPPLLVLPEEESYECHEIPEINDHNLTATDNCDPSPHVQFSSHLLGADCTDGWAVALIWNTVDRCGNERKYTLTIDIDDTVFPTLTGVPDDTTAECYPPNVPFVDCSDDCNTAKLSFHQSKHDIECEFKYKLVRRWTCVDVCDNFVEKEQTITVFDDGPPELDGVPDDTTIDCKLSFSAAPVTYKQPHCGPVRIDRNNVTTLGSCEHQKVQIYNWVATDKCNNVDSDSQTITMHDDQPPIMDEPLQYQTAPCDTVPSPEIISANDHCSYSVKVSFEETTLPGTCLNQYTIKRIWTSVDKCGNKESVECEIQVYDDENPTMTSLPNNLYETCDDISPMVTPIVDDNCDGYIKRTQWESRINGSCPHEYSLVRYYHVEDICGNVFTDNYTIYVSDPEDPVLLSTPADYSAECDEIITAPVITSTDNCGYDSTVTDRVEYVNTTCDSEYIAIREWVAVDECGRMDVHIQSVTVYDTTPPDINGHADITAEIGQIPLPWLCTWTDNCDPGSEKDYERKKEPGTCDHQFDLKYTCTVADCAGNTASVSHVIHVFDFTPPIIAGIKPDTTVEYQKVPNLEHSTQGLSATDNSFGDAYSSFQINVTTKPDVIIPGYDKNDYTIIRTFYSEDNCLNRVTKHRTITVIDRTPPCFDEKPGDTTVECDAVPEPCEIFTVGEDLNVALYEGDIDGGAYDRYMKKRKWEACDHSGNCYEHVQTLHVEDTTPPIFTRTPMDTTFECDCEGFPAMANLAAIDNCDEFVTVSNSEITLPGSCPDSYRLVRSWEAIDHAGHSQTIDQTILIQDTTPPQFSGLPNGLLNNTVECDQLGQVMNPHVDAFDNCDDDVSHKTTFLIYENGDFCNEFWISFSHEIEDDCGNGDSVQLKYGIKDTTPPSITGSKHCIYNRDPTGNYLSDNYYKSYIISDLITMHDTCWEPVHVTGVWFNRSTTDSYNTIQTSLWGPEFVRGSETQFEVENTIPTDIGTHYVFCVSARRFDSSGLVAEGKIKIQDPIRVLEISPPQCGPNGCPWRRYCVNFVAKSDTVTISLINNDDALLFRVPPYAEYLSEAADFGQPDAHLKTYANEGTWMKTCLSDNPNIGHIKDEMICDGVSLFSAGVHTEACSHLQVTDHESFGEIYDFDALPNLSDDRFCYAMRSTPWRSLTHRKCGEAYYWVITDFSQLNPNGYSWMTFDGEFFQKKRNSWMSCEEIFRSLYEDGTISSFWKEQHYKSPEVTQDQFSEYGGGDKLSASCPDPDIVSDMQCEGTCYYLNMPTAVIKNNNCWCGRDCYLSPLLVGQRERHIARRTETVTTGHHVQEYCYFTWLEGFFYDYNTQTVNILAHTTDEEGIKINMWVQVSDLCHNTAVGKVEFWVAPSLEAAAARGRVCEEPDSEVPSQASSEVPSQASSLVNIAESFAFTSHDLTTPIGVAVSFKDNKAQWVDPNFICSETIHDFVCSRHDWDCFNQHFDNVWGNPMLVSKLSFDKTHFFSCADQPLSDRFTFDNTQLSLASTLV